MAINYTNYPVRNIGTVATTVYNPTTTGIQSTLIGFNISNTSTSAITVSVTLTQGANTIYLIKNAPIPANNSFSLIDSNKIIIKKDDIIQVQSSLASSADVLASVIEVS